MFTVSYKLKMASPGKLINMQESSTEPITENVMLSSYRITRREQLKVYCKPTYHMRKLRSKGAIIVLIINYLVINLLYYQGFDSALRYRTTYIRITWGLAIPWLGWLADVCIGRHKMIHWSMWIMWVTFLLATVSSVVAQLVEGYANTNWHVTLILYIILALASASFQANIVQFGLDQLQDASTDEITSFISWYVWTLISGGIIVDCIFKCINDSNEQYRDYLRLLVCFCISIAVILFFISNNTLIKEPVIQNPFKIIYQVIKYAIKNKQPRCRSAFTYCEDHLPSRIDFGKSKYGGPFTTEQVEDVKTFLRLLPIVLLSCTPASIVYIANQLSDQINQFISNQIADKPNVTVCYKHKSYTLMVCILLALIPLYEFIIYPVFRKQLSWVKSHHKVLMSGLVQMGRVIILMAFVLKARYTSLENSGYNSTVTFLNQCIFQEEEGVLGFDRKWMILPSILNYLSIFVFCLGALEFVCAQTPYSMRGLVFGVAYGCGSLFVLIGYGITQAFKGRSWGTRMIGCEFWYSLLTILSMVIFGTSFTILTKLYTRRKRDDLLPNEQIFAERYYSTGI